MTTSCGNERRAGAKTVEEVNFSYDPLCWQGWISDQGLKKLMWYAIMEELNCKLTSPWSTKGRWIVPTDDSEKWKSKDDEDGLHPRAEVCFGQGLHT